MELTEIFRFVGALVFIIALIALCAFIAKRLGLAAGGMVGSSGSRRLAISEVRVIDAKTRLVLIRRDDREHLILVGGETSLVIESGIEAPAPAIQRDATFPAATQPVVRPTFQLQSILGHMKEAAVKSGYLKEKSA